MSFVYEIEGDYRVLATDYINWAIVHSCTEYFGGLRVAEASWVLTRKPYVINSPDFNKIADIVKPIYEKKLPNYDKDSKMRDTKQGGSCKYFTY